MIKNIFKFNRKFTSADSKVLILHFIELGRCVENLGYVTTEKLVID